MYEEAVLAVIKMGMHHLAGYGHNAFAFLTGRFGHQLLGPQTESGHFRRRDDRHFIAVLVSHARAHKRA